MSLKIHCLTVSVTRLRFKLYTEPLVPRPGFQLALQTDDMPGANANQPECAGPTPHWPSVSGTRIIIRTHHIFCLPFCCSTVALANITNCSLLVSLPQPHFTEKWCLRAHTPKATFLPPRRPLLRRRRDHRATQLRRLRHQTSTCRRLVQSC